MLEGADPTSWATPLTCITCFATPSLCHAFAAVWQNVLRSAQRAAQKSQSQVRHMLAMTPVHVTQLLQAVMHACGLTVQAVRGEAFMPLCA